MLLAKVPPPNLRLMKKHNDIKEGVKILFTNKWVGTSVLRLTYRIGENSSQSKRVINKASKRKIRSIITFTRLIKCCL